VESSEAKDQIATLKRIIDQQQHPLFASLVTLWKETHALPNAWTFPAEEGGVNGFAGLGSTFVIGEQPSGSRWSAQDRGRRLLYDGLVECGAADAHLTDIIKSRGVGSEWKQWPVERLRLHIDLLDREISQLRAKKFIVLGTQARKLFATHFPQHVGSTKIVPHFGYLRRVPHDKVDAWKNDFQETLRNALK
jgi:hypothetical protein